MMEEIRQRVLNVRERIEKAAQRNGRTGNEITLVAVSKMVDTATARIAYDLGISDFGENRVPELNNKKQSIPGARWHMIGRLQTNKVKDVVGKACLIQSLDRWHLAEELDKRAQYLGIQVPVLLEMNISGEEQKAGIKADDAEDFLKSVGELPAINVLGFMTMAPLSYEPEETRPVFRELYHLYSKLKQKPYRNVKLEYLSMGMSQDFEIAIEEGSNMVRIGSALFSG